MIRTAFALMLVSAVAVLSAQGPVAQPAPAFDVASVRPNVSGSYSSTTRALPNRSFQMVNVHLKAMIGYAYDVRHFQIVGGPDWTDAERFDVDARAPADSPDDVGTAAMLRTLLADRFKLIVRRDTREDPVYVLVRMRRDGPLGPQVKSSTRDCSAPSAGSCGVDMTTDGRGSTIHATAVSMKEVAATLGGLVDRVVLDQTGLDGRFDLELRFTREGVAGGIAGDTPSIFSALQEQLGLRLEPSRGPVGVLVIESVERPTPD